MPPQPPGGVNPSLKNPGFFKGGDLRGFLAGVHAWESPTETPLPQVFLKNFAIPNCAILIFKSDIDNTMKYVQNTYLVPRACDPFGTHNSPQSHSGGLLIHVSLT